MCSKLASLFDPLGLAAPYLLKGKLLLQKVATLGFGWDDGLPRDILREWEAWVDTLKSLSNVSLPRCCYLIEPIMQMTIMSFTSCMGFATLRILPCPL